MRSAAWLLLAASIASTACAVVRSPAAGAKPRGWIELAGGVMDLDETENGVLDDGFALALGGGLDFVQGTPDVGFDLGFAASAHDIAPGNFDPLADDDPELDVYRVYGGLRATTDLGRLPFSLYARGGWYWRSEFDESHSGLDDDRWGTYLGAGLEYAVEPNVRFGPFVVYQRLEGGGLEEWLFGFSARFYVDE